MKIDKFIEEIAKIQAEYGNDVDIAINDKNQKMYVIIDGIEYKEYHWDLCDIAVDRYLLLSGKKELKYT
jgi:hypothetical protein